MPLGVWLFYVQHTFEDAYWARKDDWDSSQAAVAGSSFYDLPRVLHWFTGNIGYHHIHHLASRIPNYRLREAFESSPLLQAAPRLTLWTSLKSARLKLWDEETAAHGRLPAARPRLTDPACTGQSGACRPLLPLEARDLVEVFLRAHHAAAGTAGVDRLAELAPLRPVRPAVEPQRRRQPDDADRNAVRSTRWRPARRRTTA